MIMQKTTALILLGFIGTLAACQSVSQQYNGKTGYQVEQRTTSSATLTYTLASDRNPEREMKKLQDACAQTLGAQKTYQIKILDTREMVSPVTAAPHSENIALGSRTTFGFSNTPQTNNNTEAYAARQVEETRPSMLKVVRYTCS